MPLVKEIVKFAIVSLMFQNKLLNGALCSIEFDKTNSEKVKLGFTLNCCPSGQLYSLKSNNKGCHYSRFYMMISSSFWKIETKNLNSYPCILILKSNHPEIVITRQNLNYSFNETLRILTRWKNTQLLSLSICSQLYRLMEPQSVSFSCKWNKLFLYEKNIGFKWNIIQYSWIKHLSKRKASLCLHLNDNA